VSQDNLAIVCDHYLSFVCFVQGGSLIVSQDNLEIVCDHYLSCVCFVQGGSYLLDLVDSAILGFPSLAVGLAELIVLFYVYGV
jgi:hypothetical protein